MIITELGLCNFGVYSGEHHLRFAVSRDGGRGSITLVGGKNGFGKTTVLEALLLALYGRRSPVVRESGKSYPSYLKDRGHATRAQTPGSWVEVGVQLDRGADHEPVLLRRSWNPATARPSENVSARRDGVEDGTLRETWDLAIDEVIPASLAALFFFDAERISRLAEQSETPQNVKDAMLSMLGLELVDHALANLRKVVWRGRRRLLDQGVSHELDRLRELYSDLDLRRKRLSQELASNAVKLERARRSLRDNEDEYFRAGGTLLERRHSLLNRQGKLNDAVAGTRAELLALGAGSLPLLLVRDQLEAVAQRALQEDSAWKAEVACSLVEERNRRLFAVTDGLADRLAAGAVRKVVEEQEAELRTLASVERLLPLTPPGLALIRDTLEHANELQSSARSSVRMLRDLEGRQQLLRSRLEGRLEASEATNKLALLSEAAQRLAQLNQAGQSLQEERARIDAEMSSADKDMVRAGELLADDAETDRSIAYALRAQETLRRFREQITREKALYLAQCIGEAVLTLSHKVRLVSGVSVDPISLRVDLLDREGTAIPRDQLSSGERQMLAVSILWGLSRASGCSVPVVIDTPLARLDSSHRLSFVAKYLTCASHQTIVLSTDTELVGPYLKALDGSVGQTYLLEYDDDARATRIVPGYFEPVSEGATA